MALPLRVLSHRGAPPSLAVGDSDPVATKGEQLAFVEVKRRKTQDKAALAVTAKQKRRIVRAAQHWIASHPGFVGHSMAFDVVLWTAWALPRHVEKAFPV
ncbi:MAG: YraN family protein [Methyloceanibacter sp.]|jgi:putative endonuclease|uniref:YraN family protein n=1 Tax=Methyloceanibacter sp. TaxID=1965321 RepID=UPI003C35946D